MKHYTGGSTRGARLLIRLAARGAPDHLSARLEEEWLAHFDGTRSLWSGLGLAMGCCWASLAISRAQPDARPPLSVVTPAGLVVRSGGVTFYERKLSYLSLRPGTLFLIMELQAAVLCGLVLPL